MKNEITFDRVVRWCIGLAVVFILYLLIDRLSGVLLPFLVSWIVAYLLNPLVTFLQVKCRLKFRMLAIVAALVIVIGSLIGLVALLAPTITQEVHKINSLVNTYAGNIHTFLPEAWEEQIAAALQEIQWDKVLQTTQAQELIKHAVPTVWNVVSGSLSMIAGVTIVFVCLLYTIFILLDYEKMTSTWSSLIPPKYRPLAEGLMADLEQGMNSYFRGQSLIALIVGVLFSIGFLIIGLPMAIVVGMFIGLLNLVPYLQTIGIIPCVILGMLQAAETGRSVWLVMLSIAIVFLVVQSIQDLVLTPRIMGDVTGLKPAIILLALSIWGSLLGMVGMIIALPMTTLMISYYKRYILRDEQPNTTEP